MNEKLHEVSGAHVEWNGLKDSVSVGVSFRVSVPP